MLRIVHKFSFAFFLAGVALLFGGDLAGWFHFGLKSSLYSYVLIVPLVSVYLLWDARSPAGKERNTSWRDYGLIVAGVLCVALAAMGFSRWEPGAGLDRGRLGIMVSVLAGGLLLGSAAGCRRARVFPAFFLFFMIPLAPSWELVLNEFLQRTSGWLAYYLILFTGTPIVRDGPFLILPDLLLEVAEECSGIRSTVVLLITSTLAGYLFLRRLATRAAFVAAVLPLGIFRNAFRILVISWLTIHVDPGVIHGPLHRRGGPLFFGLSLVILLAWGMILRRWDRKTDRSGI